MTPKPSCKGKDHLKDTYVRTLICGGVADPKRDLYELL